MTEAHHLSSEGRTCRGFSLQHGHALLMINSLKNPLVSVTLFRALFSCWSGRGHSEDLFWRKQQSFDVPFPAFFFLVVVVFFCSWQARVGRLIPPYFMGSNSTLSAMGENSNSNSNSNSKTLFYKDCSLGSFKNLS